VTLEPHIPPMAKTELSVAVGEAIRRARKQRGGVMRNVAEHLGVDVAAIGNWETGRNLPSTENLLAVANYLSVDPTALSRGEVVYLDDEPLNEAEQVTGDIVPPQGPSDVPLMGVTYGGDDGDFSFNGEVAGHVRRPPGIAGMRKVFALHVLSNSMVPRYDPGEVIYAGDREPVIGDHVVIEAFPEAGETAGKSFIKKLVKRTASEIIVEQYNPPKQLTFNRYAIKSLWRVIPYRELLGY
jgi:phage repressor protein C with HTH and peptisase S24 domain